jgi:hypothetical protein
MATCQVHELNKFTADTTNETTMVLPLNFSAKIFYYTCFFRNGTIS